MDIREIPTTQLRGSTIGFFAPMNGGKTEGMIQELKRAAYYNLHPFAYNHQRNTREVDTIVIDGKESYPATSVKDIPHLQQDLEQKIKHLRIQYHTSEIEKISALTPSKTHPPAGIKNLNEIVVGIDEINLFCLTETETKDTIQFMDWCREQNMVLFIAGLLYDFRHRPFGSVHALLPYVDIKEEKKPACMAIRADGEKCVDTAKHTQRVWSTEFAKELGLDFLIDSNNFNYVNKHKEKNLNQYIAAPYFDQTVRIEAERDKKIDYLPVCTACARLPYRSETFTVYNQIIQHLSPSLTDNRLTQHILAFLAEEKWVTREKKKPLATTFYHNSLGSFSPKK